ncbi:unnamed protein product [Orchesella dallaii]|uniref:F-box domain-containing protein n=1 Tax=Orchesella dallaii TaxID=48710 RepID=A0ABP1RLH7_9HEXA
MSLSKQNPSLSSEFPSDADASQKPIAHLPPEILTLLLNYLVCNGNRKDLLSCRLVNLQWKEIMDSLLEKNFVSGRLSPFPEIGLVVCPTSEEQSCRKLPYVRSHLTMFQDEANPLPFNGLLIDGDNAHLLPPNPEEIHVSLPMFVATAGCGNLTSLAIKNQYIDFNILVTVLGSTPSLKILRLSNVVLSKDLYNLPLVLPPPPQLPSLTILELKSGTISTMELRAKSKLLFIWLVISFADQLVKLILDTIYPFPPLRQGHSYSISVGRKTFSAGTTSDSAFGKLTNLQTAHPGREFLELSTTPALQSFYYIDIDILSDTETRCSSANFLYVTSFIDKCRETLEKLWLDATWNDLLTEAGLLYCDTPELLPTANITLPKLKLLAMRYPGLTNSSVWKENFLVKCPALKEIQVAGFHIYWDFNRCNDDGSNDAKYADEAEDEVQARILREWAAERAKHNADRRRLYEDLEARQPGRRMGEVVAEYWVEEYELWNICAGLRNVFVQLEPGKEDWYVVRKPAGPLP